MRRHCNFPLINGRISVRRTLHKNSTRVFSSFTVLLYSTVMKTIMCRKPKIVQNTVSKSITPGYGFTMRFGTGSCTFKKFNQGF